jgi:transposase-like protein
MITDKLGSYRAARNRMRMTFEHRQQKALNNRPESSHLPTRRRERIMKRFKSAQMFNASSPPWARLHESGERDLTKTCHALAKLTAPCRLEQALTQTRAQGPLGSRTIDS